MVRLLGAIRWSARVDVSNLPQVFVYNDMVSGVKNLMHSPGSRCIGCGAGRLAKREIGGPGELVTMTESMKEKIFKLHIYITKETMVSC